jgi:hypothetical protein
MSVNPGAHLTLSEKYIGLDVHRASISVAVLDSGGMVMESVIETKAATILEFIRGLGGSVQVTFEDLGGLAIRLAQKPCLGSA